MMKGKEGIPPQDHTIFSPKNKHFKIIDIYGNFDEWRDEDEDGIYHDAETWFHAMAPERFMYDML